MSFGTVGFNKIDREISPFFKFANDENPQVIMRTWKNSDRKTSHQGIRTHRLFFRCVACNKKRFSKEEWSEIELTPKYVRPGINTYFCEPCASKVNAVSLKIEKRNSKSSAWLNKIFNQKLFGTKD